MSDKLIVGISIGDFNGVGPELILRTFSNPLVFNYCVPVVYATPYLLKTYATLLNLPIPDLNIVKEKSNLKEGVINLRVCSDDRITINAGTPSDDAGKYALDSLKLLVKDVKDGLVDNILTAPIDKHSTKSAGLEFNGHTEFFAKEFDAESLMILLNDEIRVAMVTGHSALSEVPSQITEEKVIDVLAKFAHSLQFDFNIRSPKIAVLGLNPHLGDEGIMGTEEDSVIKPAIEKAQDAGILAFGPFSPDGFFGSKQTKAFDAVLGMYHDQILIPFKQHAFSDGINFTAGLPIVRTSPDHGTAYDIAGKGVADISSFVNALYLINKVHRNRKENYDSNTSFLKFKEHRREKFSIGVPDLN